MASQFGQDRFVLELLELGMGEGREKRVTLSKLAQHHHLM